MPGKHDSQSQKAVFLDRDGTLIVEKHFLKDPADVAFESGVVEGLKQLKKCGFLLILVTNQSGIGRGLLTVSDFDAVQSRLTHLLAEEGLVLDAVYMCPHHPDDDCSCRKPKPGMILQGLDAFDLDPAQCFMVGDKVADTQAGDAAGVYSILVKTGYGNKTASSFLEAVETILSRS